MPSEMSLGLMSPYHAKWDEFYEKMEGPQGCNFREYQDGGSHFTCDNSPDRPIARRILKEMGATQVEIEQSLGLFAGHGGFCDCEILFNVQSSMVCRSCAVRRNPKRTKRPTPSAPR